MASEKKEKPRKRSKSEEQTEELVKAANNVVALWMEFRKFFRMAFSSKEISQEEEKRFLEVKSNIARLQRFLAQRLPDGFHYGSNGISEIMGQSVSIGSLRELPVTDKKHLYERWHQSYVMLQNLMGILDILSEGHTVKFEDPVEKSGNIRQSLAAQGQKKKKASKGMIRNVVLAIAVAVGLAALYWYRTR